MNDGWLQIIVIIAVLFAIYMIPTIVAFKREHPNRWLIALVNFVFGCSVLGWFGTLIWACHAFLKSPDGQNGGETGLNILINDVNAVERASMSIDALDSLVKLKALLDQNVITEEEFASMKKKYLHVALDGHTISR